jgi:peptidyl-prolyl cis-trans isomerase A (cyclophilin A)
MIPAMDRRFVILSAPLMLLLSAAAPAPANRDASASGAVPVELLTDLGPIVIAVDTARAPITSGNFLAYVDGKRFDGTVFYRSMQLGLPAQQPNGLVQGGTQNDPRRVLKPIAHEPTTQTGILHKAGTVSMARYAPGTATGDFTIMLSDLAWLDANPADPASEAGAGFAAFGQVVAGMDTVRRIFDAPRSPTAGAGVMKGQMLDPPVRIVSARRVATAQPRPQVLPPGPPRPD